MIRLHTKGSRLVIIGAGGYGHEVAGYAAEIFAAQGDVDSHICFIDNWVGAASEVAQWPLHNAESFLPREGDTFIIAVGDPRLRKSLWLEYRDRNLAWGTLIHPTAHVSPFANIEEGSVVGPFSTVSFGASIGPHVALNSYCGVGHHSKIGDFSVVSPKALIAGKAELRSSVFIGSGAVVTPGKVVEMGAKVGAGSVVYRSVKENQTVIGNPAKVILKNKTRRAGREE